MGDVIKGAIVKGYSSFGCFFDVNGEIDVLVHLQEISYSRVNHPDEIFNVGDKHDLLIISIDKEKLQIGCSIKQLSPDPFEHISNYELNKPYKVKSAISLQYQKEINSAPKITAKGEGWVAEKIIEIAQERNIPIRKDKDLLNLLSEIDVGREVPESLYKVVAELLAWVYQLNKNYPDSHKPN